MPPTDPTHDCEMQRLGVFTNPVEGAGDLPCGIVTEQAARIAELEADVACSRDGCQFLAERDEARAALAEAVGYVLELRNVLHGYSCQAEADCLTACDDAGLWLDATHA